MTDTSLMYFGDDAPNGIPFTAEELDILRTAFEIAFESDPENWQDWFNDEVVTRVGQRIEAAFGASTAEVV